MTARDFSCCQRYGADNIELAAIDRNAGFLREQARSAAERNGPSADPPDGTAVVLAEIRNCLVIGNKAAGEPHYLNVASGLTLEPAARLNPVEVALDVELQQYRRPAGCLGIDPAEPKLGQIEFADEDVDDTNWIVLADPVFHAFRKQSALPTIRTLNKTLHPIPRAGIISRESRQAQRFHTARVIRDGLVGCQSLPVFPQHRT